MNIISKLSSIADKLDEDGMFNQADVIDKIATELLQHKAYKPRLKRQKKVRGVAKIKRNHW